MDKYALIVAGGSGSRMNTDIPKQFLLLHGVPILVHTINAFLNADELIKVVLVLPEDQFDTWKELIKQHQLNYSFNLIKGGNSRFQSVKNGLEAIPNNALVAIHDGVRPMVSKELIASCYHSALVAGSGIAAVPLKDSIRKMGNSTSNVESKMVDRSQFMSIQTPQTFQSNIIKQAYKQIESKTFTDDSSVAEKAGIKIALVNGNYSNIKITTKEDLVVAEALIQHF